MIEEKYTINLDINKRFGGLIVGDLFNVVNGDIIIGPYCQWPKTEPRYFVVTSGKTGGKSLKLEEQLRNKFK